MLLNLNEIHFLLAGAFSLFALGFVLSLLARSKAQGGNDLAQRLEQAAAECGDNRLIFAPGCSLPLDIDFEAVHQLRVVVDEYNQKR